MSDQELEARVEASRADWYTRAGALGVTAPTADTWAALNPGTDWAANEDRTAELNRWHADDHGPTVSDGAVDAA